MRQPFESIERQIELMFELQFYNMGLALSIFEEGIARLAAAAKVQADAQPRATPQRLTPYPPTHRNERAALDDPQPQQHATS
jgi:hypothetical protein